MRPLNNDITMTLSNSGTITKCNTHIDTQRPYKLRLTTGLKSPREPSDVLFPGVCSRWADANARHHVTYNDSMRRHYTVCSRHP